MTDFAAPPIRDPLSGAPVPEPMVPFVDILGLSGAVDLSFAVGFSRVNVPVEPTEGQLLVKLAGQETARKLSEAMAGERIYVPFCRAFLAHYYRARGATVPELARLLKCSERYVYIALRSQPHWSKAESNRTP